MDVVIGLSLGLGLLLIWSAFAMPTPPKVRLPKQSEVSIGSLAGLSVAAALVAGLAVFLISRTASVAAGSCPGLAA